MSSDPVNIVDCPVCGAVYKVRPTTVQLVGECDYCETELSAQPIRHAVGKG